MRNRTVISAISYKKIEGEIILSWNKFLEIYTFIRFAENIPRGRYAAEDAIARK